MSVRYPPPSDELLQRAARLYRIPGVTQAEVCARLGLSRVALKRARERFDGAAFPWPRDLLLSCLTDAGRRTRGAWPTRQELATLASYLDFVDKDGSTADSVAALLASLVQDGILDRDADDFVLRVPFP
ncbi:MAG: hypothetical protein RBU37_06150 [Myxococcota bacterium]|jgi:hypothetical protein|nr:hypothetical protein [Myxococcota bacterium]